MHHLPSHLQLVSQYLHLGSAMKRCSVAVEAYANALNDANTNEEMLALLRAPPTGPMPSGMPGMMPFLSTKAEEDERASAAGAGSKKRSVSDEPADDAGAPDGKKKRKNKKKEHDPNAPKRPPSAYLVFQNDVREKVRSENPDVKYSEVLTIIGEQWKALGEAGQAAYKEKAVEAMNNWKAEAETYHANNPKADAANGGDTSMADADAKPAKKPKKEKKEKPASSTSAKPAAAAPSASTSTPAAKNAPKPAPTASTKKNQPQQPAVQSEGSSSSEDEDEDSDSDDSD